MSLWLELFQEVLELRVVQGEVAALVGALSKRTWTVLLRCDVHVLWGSVHVGVIDLVVDLELLIGVVV